jgi:endonuclease G
MKRVFYYIIAIAIVALLFYLQRWQNDSISADNFEGATIENQLSIDDFLPQSDLQIVHHNTYSLAYNEKHEQAAWTAHILRPSDIKKAKYKRPYFEIDDMVHTGAASWRNYKNSGYDRGHLVPAGDRRASLQDYEETFLTSNISPQIHDFNAGIWNTLEQKTRYYAQRHGALYVITGSILKPGLASIGSENVSVPEYFYKILLHRRNDEVKILAFLIPHRDTDQSIYKFMTSVDDLEVATGIDFFYQLPDALEEQLEKTVDRSSW